MPAKKTSEKTTAAKKAPAKKAPAKKAPAKKASAKKAARKSVSAETRFNMIQEAAYYLAESNGFGGDAAQYWEQAERQVDEMLKG
jgi:hypothetical protein